MNESQKEKTVACTPHEMTCGWNFIYVGTTVCMEWLETYRLIEFSLACWSRSGLTLRTLKLDLVAELF